MATPVHVQVVRRGESLEEVLLGRMQPPLLEQQVSEIVLYAVDRGQVGFDRVEGERLVVMLASGRRLMNGLIGEAKAVVHLGQKQEILDHARCRRGSLVIANRRHP